MRQVGHPTSHAGSRSTKGGTRRSMFSLCSPIPNMSRFFPAVVLALMPTIAVSQTRESPGVTVFGEGNNSCATAFAPERSSNTFNWIMGFWSGMNLQGNVNVGQNTDAKGIVAEIKLTCDKAPSQALINAAYGTYGRMKAK